MNDSQHVNVELFEVILLSYSTLSYIERKNFNLRHWVLHNNPGQNIWHRAKR